MRRFYLIGFLSLMLTDTGSQTFSKLAAMGAGDLAFDLDWIIRVMQTPWVYLTLVCYLGSFVTWIMLLRYAPVGSSFAASHMELIPVTIVSVLLFDEPMNMWKVLGGVLILLGVFCLAKGEEMEDARTVAGHDSP